MKILVYPKDSNPYQSLLYSQFPKFIKYRYLVNVPNVHLIGLFLLPFQLVFFRLVGYQIFHIHWFYTFRIKSKNPIFRTFFFRVLFTYYFSIFICLIKLLGYKLVWTVHDLKLHNNYFVNDEKMMKFMAKISDAKIVHSSFTTQEMISLNLNVLNTHRIGIGNYSQPYLNNVSQHQARKKLGIKDSTFVVGIFGKLEEYKGVRELVKAFLKANLDNSLLLIVGACSSNSLEKYLKNAAKEGKGILLHLSFITDDEVQIYLNSYDVLAYPFRTITTSSSVLLAMSFKKPVIAPKIGEISELPKNTGLYYNAKNTNDLLKALIFAHSHKSNLSLLGKNAFRYVDSLDWKESSQKTILLYQQISRK